MRRFQLFDLINGDLVITEDFHLKRRPAHFAQFLDEVVGKRIIIIDQNDHAG